MARILTGIVVSDKNAKTITVQVDRHRRHPLYSKSYKVSRKFAAHDEKQEANVGDKVEIVETRPISRTKNWRLQKIVERAEGTDPLAETEDVVKSATKKDAPAQASKSEVSAGKEEKKA